MKSLQDIKAYWKQWAKKNSGLETTIEPTMEKLGHPKMLNSFALFDDSEINRSLVHLICDINSIDWQDSTSKAVEIIKKLDTDDEVIAYYFAFGKTHNKETNTTEVTRLHIKVLVLDGSKIKSTFDLIGDNNDELKIKYLLKGEHNA